MVYFGGSGEPEEEARRAGVPSDVLDGLHESLLAMEGESHEIQLNKIIVSPDLVCALVSFVGFPLPSTTGGGDQFHVTLGTRNGVKPVEAIKIVEKVMELSIEDLAEEDIACVTLKKVKQYTGKVELRMSDDE